VVQLNPGMAVRLDPDRVCDRANLFYDLQNSHFMPEPTGGVGSVIK
jgi:hypothetical protein